MTGSDVAERLGRLLDERGATVAVAESMTGGLLVQALAKVEGSSEWLAGGVVAYSTSVKRELLDVTADKVVSREAAEQLASGARRRLGADVAVSVTGAAGPEGQDGEPPGTVWIGIDDGATASASLLRAEGAPDEVCDRTVDEAIRRVIDALGAGPPG